jgi:hypothetical protein
VFDAHNSERIKIWRDFRQQLELSPDPLQDVATFWSRAPFVNKYLDPYNTKSWPDPWKLVIDNKYDDLAICLGMCYTLQLTERFKDREFEIHMSMSPNEKRYTLLVDNGAVLNWEPRVVSPVSDLPPDSISIWHS